MVKNKEEVKDIELNIDDNDPTDIVSAEEVNAESVDDNIFDNFDENSLFDDFE